MKDDFLNGMVLFYHLLMVATTLFGSSALHMTAHLGVQGALSPKDLTLVVFRLMLL